MATEDATVQRKTGGSTLAEKFIFRALAPLENAKKQPVSGIPLIEASSANNVLFRFVGQTEQTTFTFAIFDDNTDVSGGTHTSTVITVAEQIQYLRDVVFSAEFDTLWTLTQSRYYPSGVNGVITNLKYDNVAGSGTVVTGTFTFMRGRIGLTS